MSRGQHSFDSDKQNHLPSGPESEISSQRMLRLVLDSIPQGVFWKDRQSRYLGCNRIVAAAFGLSSPDDIVGLDDHHLRGLTREQANNFIADDRKVIESDEPVLGIIEQASLANGSTIWMETNKYPMHNAKGSTIGVIGTWQDITTRNQAEAKLCEREEQLHVFIQHSPVALAMFDCEMRYLQASRRWKMDLKLGDEDLRGKSHYEVFPGITERWKHVHRRGLAGEVVREEEDRFERIDGSVQWIRWEVRPWHDQSGNVGGILIFLEEITERQRAKEDQARLAAIVESCEDAIIGKSLDGTILSWNAGAQRLFGYASHEAIGQSITLIVPPERTDEENDILARLARGELLQHYETVRLTKDGRRRDVSLTISPIRNARGQIVGASKIARDVTAQNHASNALYQREALLRHVRGNSRANFRPLLYDQSYRTWARVGGSARHCAWAPRGAQSL